MSRALLEEDILGHYQSLMRHVADTHAREFLEVDLTMSQAKVLYVVALRPGIGMSALAAELQIGLSAVSGLVDRLVSSGHLARQQDPADRRQQLVSVTDGGMRALDRLRELRGELMRRLLGGLATEELAALREGLSALDREARHLAAIHVAPVSQPERTPA